MMRVMMLSWEYPPRSVGGLAEHVFHLSRELAREGVDVAVVTAGLPDCAPETTDQGVSVYRIAGGGPAAPEFLSWVMSLNLEMFARAARVLSPLLCLRDRGLRNRRPIIIHAHDWLVMFAARALKHYFRLPLVATVHATEAGRQGGLHTAEQKFISDCEWLLTYEAWRVICCSDFMASELAARFAVPADKLRVIPNGVDPGQLTPTTVDPRRRSRFALDTERIVFFIGRLVPEKGAQILVAAAPRILAKHPSTKFVIAGTGPYAPELERLASALGVRDKVCFAGYVDDETRRLLYHWADVAVFPSSYEPFGIVALEAMATMTPVIVASTGGLAETVADGRNGLCVPPGSAVAVAEAIDRVLADSGLRTRLIEGGLETVRRYTWESVAAKTRRVYAEAIGDRSLRSWGRSTCPVGADWISPSCWEGIVR